MSSIRSASSRTSSWICFRLKAPRSSRSSRRPGVATTMCAWAAFFAWAWMPTPPNTGAIFRAREWAIERSSSTICSASSGVGASTSAAGRRESAAMRSTIGTPKASVLPDPVGDWTRTSSSARTSAMQSLCTANGSVMPRSASAPSTGRDTPRSANDSDDMKTELLMYALRWRSCDPNQRRIRSAMREETEPLGDPCGRPDDEDGSRRLGLEPGAGFPDGDRRAAAGLGDLVVGALWVALDLELDPRLRADLQALLVVQVLVDGLE